MRARDLPAADRLADKFEILPNGCWQWTGYITPQGYGACGYRGHRNTLAHRAVWMEFVGPIPEGAELDHTCHTDAVPDCPLGAACPHRSCVNPDHLEPVTHLVNTLRGHEPRKPACVHGHQYTPGNTYRDPSGRRRCVECHTLRHGYPPVRGVAS